MTAPARTVSGPEGSFEIARFVASRAMNPFWRLGMIDDILLILLAFWVSGSDRVYALQQRTYLILFWVGFLALFKGISQIMLAFLLESLLIAMVVVMRVERGVG